MPKSFLISRDAERKEEEEEEETIMAKRRRRRKRRIGPWGGSDDKKERVGEEATSAGQQTVGGTAGQFEPGIHTSARTIYVPIEY